MALGQKGFIFDLDGTLVDSLQFHYKAWNEVLGSKRMAECSHLFYELAGIPSEEIVRELNSAYGWNLDPEETVQKKDFYFKKFVPLIKPILRVAGVARYWYQKGVPMAIGTGTGSGMTELILENTGLSKFFEVVVTSDDVNEYKPEPETFIRCSELMNVEPEDCLVYEDGDRGITAAFRAGMKVVDVRNYRKSRNYETFMNIFC